MIFDFIRIENGSDTALWRQIYEQFAAAVDGGRIAPLTRLPSIRELAAGLSVSRSPVENAYERLHLDGYIVSRPKSGCFTAPRRREAARGAASRSHHWARYDLVRG
ncbi:MAG: GntR family transcriptional regulator [Cloacibacillus evryensis]